MKNSLLKILVFVVLVVSSFVSKAQSVTIVHAHDSLHFTCGAPIQPFGFHGGGGFTYLASGLNPADSLTATIYWGDGTINTYTMPNNQLNASGYGGLELYSHFYLNYGTYDMSFVVRESGGAFDSICHPAEVIIDTNCVMLTKVVYEDVNGNCVYDSGEPVLSNLPAKIYNGISRFSDRKIWSGMPLNQGIFYSVQLDTIAGYAFTCPANGISNFTAQNDTTIYFAVQCPPNVYDHRISHFLLKVRPMNTSTVFVYPSNPYCIAQNGNYSIDLSPKLSFIASLPSAASVSGNVVGWQHNNLRYNTYGQSAFMYANPDPSLVIGDSVCTTASIDVLPGDINPSNNISTRCTPVSNSYDPNDKMVQPKGTGSNGAVPPGTDFTYLIMFQNTGNDTAKRVYVMDTLSTNLDLSTFKVIYSSHPYKLLFPSDNVVRFQFDNINLPDSTTNEPASHGYIVYTIDSRDMLMNGTSILNRAYIYFDYNPPIITSATLNTIDFTLGVNVVEPDVVSVSPNPASEEFIISSDKSGDYTLQLFDINGRLVRSVSYAGSSYTVRVADLPAGIYSGTLLSKDKLKSFRLVVVH